MSNMIEIPRKDNIHTLVNCNHIVIAEQYYKDKEEKILITLTTGRIITVEKDDAGGIYELDVFFETLMNA